MFKNWDQPSPQIRQLLWYPTPLKIGEVVSNGGRRIKTSHKLKLTASSFAHKELLEQYKKIRYIVTTFKKKDEIHVYNKSEILPTPTCSRTTMTEISALSCLCDKLSGNNPI
jgi:hypothetical protein